MLQQVPAHLRRLLPSARLAARPDAPSRWFSSIHRSSSPASAPRPALCPRAGGSGPRHAGPSPQHPRLQQSSSVSAPGWRSSFWLCDLGQVNQLFCASFPYLHVRGQGHSRCYAYGCHGDGPSFNIYFLGFGETDFLLN